MLTQQGTAVRSGFLIPIWATVMQTCSKKLYCAPLHKQKLFKDWPPLWRGKLYSSEKQHWLVFYYTVFLQWPSTWKQLSSWAILALTSRSTLMRSICKKKEEKKKRGRRGREPVIREIKSYVYSVMAHILWSGAKCGVLERKQIACPGTRLCLFLVLSLESHKKMWALKTNVMLQNIFRWFISLMLDRRNTLPYLQESLQAPLQGHVRSRDLSCSQALLYPAAICSTLGGHFAFSDAFFPLPLFPTLQHGDNVL